MAELAFMSIDPENEISNLDDDQQSDSSAEQSNIDVNIPKLEKIENHIHGFIENLEKEPGTETVEICEDTVNPHGKVNAEDFSVLKVVGKGGYGTVFLVQKATDSLDKGKFYAMKVLKKAKLVCNEKNTAHTVSERNILQMLKHPFLVRLHYAFQNRSSLYIVLEYCPGGELFRYLEREGFLLEDAACFYIAEIALAIGHLHSLGIIYRDLKPENILLDKTGHVKLTDFGLSKEGVNTTNTFCGTIEYMAPEIIRCAGHGRSVDWWSLGTLLFDMLSGGPPFSQEGNKKITAEKILKNHVKFPPSFSPEAISLIKGLLKKDPKERLGTKNDVEDIKRHRFFDRYEVNWNDVYDRKIEPPFKPELKSESDVSMFDPTFTGLQPIVSPGNSVDPTPNDLFQGFSFVASSVVETPIRTTFPDINRSRGNQRNIRGSMTIGRLSRLNGAATGPLVPVNGAHSLIPGKVHAWQGQKQPPPTNSILSSSAHPTHNNRIETLAMDTDNPFEGGLDMSDFASSRPQTSDLLKIQNKDDQRDFMDVDGGIPRVLTMCHEEEDEDNIPGAKHILGRGSPCESKLSTGIRHYHHPPSKPKKTLAEIKPVSYPNLLHTATDSTYSSHVTLASVQHRPSNGDLTSSASSTVLSAMTTSKKSPRSTGHNQQKHAHSTVNLATNGKDTKDAKCSIM